MHPLTEDAEPVDAHSGDHRRMADDRRSPFDRVNLGDECRRDQARPLEDLLIRPAGVLVAQSVADGVVLQDEQSVHHGEAHPEPGHARRVPFGVVREQRPVPGDLEFAVLSRAQLPLGVQAVAVELGCVPPVRFLVDVRRRQPVVTVRAGRVGERPRHEHRPVRPGVVVGQLDVPGAVHRALPMADPVPDHELQPRRDQGVDGLRGDELMPREHGSAHLTWARRHDLRLGFGEAPLRRGVMAEA